MVNLTNDSLAMIFVAIAVAIVVLLTVQSSPLVYYVYCLLPVPLWYAALKRLVKVEIYVNKYAVNLCSHYSFSNS